MDKVLQAIKRFVNVIAWLGSISINKSTQSYDTFLPNR